jgi:hypothetical protein
LAKGFANLHEEAGQSLKRMHMMLRHSVLRRFASRLPTAALAMTIIGSSALLSSANAQTQTTTRTTVITRTTGGPVGVIGVGRFNTVTTIQQTSVSDVGRRAMLGDVIPVDQLPVVVGIRRTPVAPPTVYRIEGPRTAMHRADEERMRQINPGARVITPDDVSLSPRTRARYAVQGETRPRAMRVRSAAAQNRDGMMMPQIIIVRPSGTY